MPQCCLYDLAGNRTAKTNQLSGDAEQYAYDPLYQLTQVTQGALTTESYAYDQVGNRVSSLGQSPYTYNVSNELLTAPRRGSPTTSTATRRARRTRVARRSINGTSRTAGH